MVPENAVRKYFLKISNSVHLAATIWLFESLELKSILQAAALLSQNRGIEIRPVKIRSRTTILFTRAEILIFCVCFSRRRKKTEQLLAQDHHYK